MLRTGCRWCDCPAEHGPSRTVYDRFNRWSRREAALRPFPSGDRLAIFWFRLLEALVAAGAITRSTAIDSTYVKAQRAAFGGKEGIRRRRSAGRAAAGRPGSTRSLKSSAALVR